jgi:single-strand DNA-binding protein
LNHFTGIGRVTGDAETRYAASGTSCTKFSICINKTWKDKNGERKNKPNFFNCVLWGKYGELMQKYLTKGKQIGIEGELEQNTWTDNGGSNHSAVQITVNEIELLASPRGEKTPHADESAAPDAADIPF